MKNKFFTSLATQDFANIVPAAMHCKQVYITSLHDKFAGYGKVGLLE